MNRKHVVFTEKIDIILSHLTIGGCWLIFYPAFKFYTGACFKPVLCLWTVFKASCFRSKLQSFGSELHKRGVKGVSRKCTWEFSGSWLDRHVMSLQLILSYAQLFFWHGEDKRLAEPFPSPLCSWNERQSLLLLLKPVAPSTWIVKIKTGPWSGPSLLGGHNYWLFLTWSQKRLKI